MLIFILSGALLNKITICFTTNKISNKTVRNWSHDTNISPILNSLWQIDKYKDMLYNIFSD